MLRYLKDTAFTEAFTHVLKRHKEPILDENWKAVGLICNGTRLEQKDFFSFIFILLYKIW